MKWDPEVLKAAHQTIQKALDEFFRKYNSGTPDHKEYST
jgi:hypothetical protein